MGLNKKLKFIVITSGSYPYGSAASNRHLSYLKGLVKLGNEVKLIIIQPDVNQSVLSNKVEGNFDGVEFMYMSWYKNQPQKLYNKIIHKLKGHYKAIKILEKLKHDGSDDIVFIILITQPLEILPYLLFCKARNIKIFHERTEYPFISSKGIVKKILLYLYLKFIIPKFDGIYLISNALVEYFSMYVNEDDKLLVLPMTVDFDRFSIIKNENDALGKYLAYCGSMYSDKDGVPDLINAFNIFANAYKDYNLVLIGDNSNIKKFRNIKDTIDDSPFKSRIICTGWVERDEIPQLLKNASILVLARPDNLQAKGGFPTKLGEYLATANPVIITNVGEHSNFLKDGESAFIAEPNNPKAFANKIIECVSDYERATNIGINGYQVANKYFNNLTQAIILQKFFDSKI